MWTNHHLRSVKTWIGLLLIVLAATFTAQETLSVPGVPRPLGVDYTRNLSDQQIAQIQSAINTIAGGPPISFSWNGGNGNQTAFGAVIAAELQWQLSTGRIDALPMGPGEYAEATIDMTESPYNDQMTINSNKLTEWLAPGSQKYLQETLIHEWAHKKQTTAQHPTDNARELDAYRCELAYKNAIGMGYDDPEYRFVASQDIAYMEARIAEIGEEDCAVRPLWPSFTNGNEYYILFDSNRVAGVDSLVGFRFGENVWSTFQFDHRASDMKLFEASPLVPPGHSLAVVCGGFPMTGEAGVFAYDLIEGEVFAVLPPRIFAPPDNPPMYFYSMARGPDPAFQYYLDTLGHKVLAMMDINLDGLPEILFSEYASLGMPGFEVLAEARGIDYVTSPWLGSGLLVNTNDVHLPPHHNLSDMFWFLPDNDHNHIADACMPVNLWAFKEVLPVAGGNIPWAGDMTVNLYASWQHHISVMSTDSVGGMTFGEVGSMVMMDGVHGICALNRPLEAGEFVLAQDNFNGTRVRLAAKVIDPTIHDLTLLYADGLLHFRWTEIPGARQYELMQSPDGMIYVPTGLLTMEPSFILPFPPDPLLHYQVAVRR
ncbi:MAG: hypothetical protein IPH10_00515 [bacterium]|nr:hypothetical protein [bacterium]